MKLFAQNRKAFHNYTILETFEAGIVLTGNEVKSVKQNHVSLQGAYAIVSSKQLILINCHINAYKYSYDKSKKDELRNRTLLIKKKDILKLEIMIKAERVTLIPLKIYANEKGKIKCAIGIAKHKNSENKKEEIKERDIARSERRENKQ